MRACGAGRGSGGRAAELRAAVPRASSSSGWAATSSPIFAASPRCAASSSRRHRGSKGATRSARSAGAGRPPRGRTRAPCRGASARGRRARSGRRRAREQVDHRGLPEPRRNVQRRRAARAAEVDAEAEGARQQLLHLLHVAVARRVEQLPVIDQLIARELQAERAGDGARRGGARARERAVEVEVADVVEQAAAKGAGTIRRGNIHFARRRGPVNTRWRFARRRSACGCRPQLATASSMSRVTAKKRLNS